MLRAHGRPALLRPGLRGPGPGARRRPRPGRARRRGRDLPRRAPRPLRLRLRRRRHASRSSGSTCGSPASARSAAPRSAVAPRSSAGRRRRRAARLDARRPSTQARSASTPTRGTSTPRSCSGPTSRPATTSTGPAVIEEYGSTVPLHPGFTATVDDVRQPARTSYAGGAMSRRVPTDFPFGPLTADAGAGADPVLVEIVAGLAGQRRGGGRDRDRADQPQPDDPRRPRLPGRHPRPAAAQAHRPLVLRARAPGRARLPDRRDARRATCSSTTTSTAPRAASATCPTCASPCRSSRDGRASVRVRPGVRPPRRHRRRGAGLDAERAPPACSRRA